MESTIKFVFIYKIFCLVIGAFTNYLGYKLFIKGFIEKQGELLVNNKNWIIKFRHIAPGIFFCILGTFIILYNNNIKYSEQNLSSNKPFINPEVNDSDSLNEELDTFYLLKETTASLDKTGSIPSYKGKNSTKRIGSTMLTIKRKNNNKEFNYSNEILGMYYLTDKIAKIWEYDLPKKNISNKINKSEPSLVNLEVNKLDPASIKWEVKNMPLNYSESTLSWTDNMYISKEYDNNTTKWNILKIDSSNSLRTINESKIKK